MINLTCFTSPNPQDHHFGPINQARFSSDGKLFVSAGKDGAIKLWDGVTGRCVNTLPNAHGAGQVYSVSFSRNCKYLLSSGQDQIVKLWDVSTMRQVRVYKNSPAQTATPLPEHACRAQACFNYDEEFVMSSDKSDICVWSTRSSELLWRLPGHNKQVRWLAASPVEQSFMSCSDDTRARFWADEELLKSH